MSPKKFSTLYVAQLATEEIYSLSKSTIDLSTPVVDELGIIAAGALTQLSGATATLGTNLNKGQKSSLTDEMKTYETGRDNDLSSLFRIVKSYLKSNDPAKREAASKLQLFLAPYKGVARLPIDVESGVIFELTAKYNASDGLKAAAQSIHTTDFFASLESNNAAFDKLYNDRTIEKASKTDSASSVKTKTATAYNQYCTAIEQALAFTPSDTLLALFNQLDTLRKQYRPLESGRK